jgi:tRNA(fMet)-specific endonuclease VapC
VILLDTDHLTTLTYPESARCQALRARLDASPNRQIATTIISVEEQWRGWFAVIARHREVRRHVKAYRELLELNKFHSGWTILPFDETAADQFDLLRAARVRIGTMDLKIASIALVHGALVLSAIWKISRRCQACGWRIG